VRPGVDRIEAARNVRRAAASRIDGRSTGGAVDLSPDAIAARQRTGNGGMTGRQLIDTADVVFARAKRLAKAALRAPSGRRRAKLSRTADDALRSAAVQIRLAERTPLDRSYLHALDLAVVQTVKAEVGKAFDIDDGAALAVDTHRKIQDQRERARREGIQR
jgi:hypothetical protein